MPSPAALGGRHRADGRAGHDRLRRAVGPAGEPPDDPRRGAVRGDHAQAFAAARSAEALYRGDFRAYADDSEWARAEREHIAGTRLEMLCDGARAALQLGRFRDGLGLAATAVRADPYSEPAHRALMRAYAGLGDIGSALRVFEIFRARLAEHLGADPSDQIMALHVGLQHRGPG